MNKCFIILGILLISSYSFTQINNNPHFEDIKALKGPGSDLEAVAVEPPAVSTGTIKAHASSLDYGNGPGWAWTEQFGGSGRDYARDIITDSEGNIIVCGSFSGMIGIGDSVLYSQGDWDAIVAKFQGNGQLSWIKQFKAAPGERIEANGIYIDNSGVIYLTGYFTGSANIGEYSLNTYFDFSTFMAWMDSQGDIQMAKDIPGVGGNSAGYVIEKDGTGNIYILGSQLSTSYSYSNPTIIFKCDDAGELITTFFNEQSFCGMKINGEDIFFAGTINSAGYIGGFYFDPVSYSDAFVAMSDLDFNFDWAEMAGHQSSGYSRCYDMFVSPDNDIYLRGYYYPDLIFGQHQIQAASTFIGKCNLEGNFTWLSAGEYSWSGQGLTTGISANNTNVYLSYSFYDQEHRETGYGIAVYQDLNGNYLANIVLDYSAVTTCFNPVLNKVNVFGENNQLLQVAQLNVNMTQDWTTAFSGNSAYGDIYSVDADPAGDVYIYGYASNELDYFGQTIGKGLFLARQDDDGDVVWINSLPECNFSWDAGKYMVVDTNSGMVYITGKFYYPLNIPGGPTLNPVYGGSTFLISFDQNGNYSWSTQIDHYTWNLSLCPDQSGNILLSGIFDEVISIGDTTLIPIGYVDFFVSKFNPGGEFLWAIRAGGEGDDDMDYECFIGTDAQDNIYFTGEVIAVTASVDDVYVTMNPGDGNHLMAKIGPDGDVIWVKVKGGSPIEWNDDYSWPTALVADPSGNFYVKGQHNDSTYFDDILLLSPYSRYSKFIAKFDTDGNTLWANSINEKRSGLGYSEMDIDQQGNVYLGGVCRDTTYFGEDYTYVINGLSDMYFASYTSQGELDWVKIMEGTSTTSNAFRGTATINSLRQVIGGRFYYFLNLGESTILTSNNGHGFVSMADLPTWIMAYDKNNGEGLFSIYPNPTDGNFVISMEEIPSGPVSIVVSDLDGKIIGIYGFDKGQQEYRVRMNGLSSGFYLVRGSTGERSEVIKLLIK